MDAGHTAAGGRELEGGLQGRGLAPGCPHHSSPDDVCSLRRAPRPRPQGRGSEAGNQRTWAPPQLCHQPLNLSPGFRACKMGYSYAFGELWRGYRGTPREAHRAWRVPYERQSLLLPLLSLLSFTHRNLSRQPSCPWGRWLVPELGVLGSALAGTAMCQWPCALSPAPGRR